MENVIYIVICVIIVLTFVYFVLFGRRNTQKKHDTKSKFMIKGGANINELIAWNYILKGWGTLKLNDVYDRFGEKFLFDLLSGWPNILSESKEKAALDVFIGYFSLGAQNVYPCDVFIEGVFDIVGRMITAGFDHPTVLIHILTKLRRLQPPNKLLNIQKLLSYNDFDGALQQILSTNDLRNTLQILSTDGLQGEDTRETVGIIQSAVGALNANGPGAAPPRKPEEILGEALAAATDKQVVSRALELMNTIFSIYSMPYEAAVNAVEAAVNAVEAAPVEALELMNTIFSIYSMSDETAIQGVEDIAVRKAAQELLTTLFSKYELRINLSDYLSDPTCIKTIIEALRNSGMEKVLEENVDSFLNACFSHIAGGEQTDPAALESMNMIFSVCSLSVVGVVEAALNAVGAAVGAFDTAPVEALELMNTIFSIYPMPNETAEKAAEAAMDCLKSAVANLFEADYDPYEKPWPQIAQASLELLTTLVPLSFNPDVFDNVIVIISKSLVSQLYSLADAAYNYLRVAMPVYKSIN